MPTRLEWIYNFFNSPIIVIIWWIATVIMVIWFLYTIYLIIKWVLPVRYRLWIGLSKREIAIFADSKFDELSWVLIDSKIFSKRNIIKIELSNIKKANDISLLLVHRDYIKNNVNNILNIKNHSDALIIYAPQDEWFIDKNILAQLNLQSNCTIVNFRWRLLNDILVSMITTSYEKR